MFVGSFIPKRSPSASPRFRASISSGRRRTRLGVFVLSWGWKSESSDLLWRVVETAPQWRSQALWFLWQISRADRDAAGLLRVASNQHEDDPKDIRYKNNYAFYLLLLRSLDLAGLRRPR